MDIAKITSEILIEIGAAYVNLEKPFIFTSGTVSPAYVDCRKIISFPHQRRKIIELATSLINDNIGMANIDVIAGGETAGIPFAAWLSEYLNLPMIYVRKKPKDVGRLGQVEGDVKEDKKVLLVEDLIFDAKSKLNFCNGITKTGAIVEHILVVFDYGHAESRKNLETHGLELHSMTSWDTLLQVAEEKKYFTKEECGEIQKFLQAPTDWAKEHKISKHLR